MSDAEELAKLDALRQSEVLSQEEFDAERAMLPGAVPPSAGSGSTQSNGAEAALDEGSLQTSDGEHDLPESYPDHRALLTPSGMLVETDTQPPLAVPEQPTLPFATAAPLGTEERRSNGVRSGAELASEKAKLIDRILSSAVLDSSAAHDLGPTEQTNGAEESHDQGQQARPPSLLEQPYEQASTEAAYRAPTSFAGPVSTVQTVGAKKSRRRPRLSPLVVAVLAGVFFVSTLGTGLLALNRNEVAGQWRQQDQTEVAGNHVLSTHNHVLSTHNHVLSTNLVSARSSITSLDSQRSKLSGQVTSLTTQLSAVANAKAKALDQNALLIQLTNQAGTVSNELSTCVDDMDSLITEIDNDLSDLSYNDPYLQSNADAAGQICSTAQQDNQTLQATLSGTG
jgi:hypothetical protein